MVSRLVGFRSEFCRAQTILPCWHWGPDFEGFCSDEGKSDFCWAHTCRSPDLPKFHHTSRLVFCKFSDVKQQDSKPKTGYLNKKMGPKGIEPPISTILKTFPMKRFAKRKGFCQGSVLTIVGLASES
jgi:hypothetical protein